MIVVRCECNLLKHCPGYSECFAITCVAMLAILPWVIREPLLVLFPIGVDYFGVGGI
jgi:hypothetical protein